MKLIKLSRLSIISIATLLVSLLIGVERSDAKPSSMKSNVVLSSVTLLSLLSALLIPMSAISVNATEPGEGVQRDKEHRVHCTKSKWGIKLCKLQSRLCTQPWSRGTDTKGEVIETWGARNCSD